MTYGVQLLLVLNIAAAIINKFIFPLEVFFHLDANWWAGLKIWQLVTYQFLHKDFGHILFNMLALFFIGPEVERGVGTHRFFTLYLMSGILGGLGWSLISPPWHSCVGASGAIFGVLGAFAVLYPYRELYVWGILPVKAWLLVVILGAYELLHVLGGPGGAVANAAHFGGGIAGTIYTLVVGRPDIMRKIRRNLVPKEKPPISRAEIDRILDKAAQHGMHSLTPAERAALKRAGRQ